MVQLILIVAIIVLLLDRRKHKAGTKSSLLGVILAILAVVIIAHVVLRVFMATIIGHLIFGMISLIRWALTIVEIIVAIIVIRWLLKRRK